MSIDEKREPEQIDIRDYSFDRFVTFIFDRDASGDSSTDWYWQVNVIFDPQSVCNYYAELFTHPDFLRNVYSKPQLDQGFWALQSGTDFSVMRIIWDERLPFAHREQLVRTMFDLFRQLFASEPLDTAVYMWWDSLCYDWHCGNRKRENGGEDLSMQDVMFETLSRVLSLDSEHCRSAALHGLGHLRHPLTRDLIVQFLASNPTLNEEIKTYALAAAEFKVL